MNWHTALVELLPTKWSRWTAGSSLPLTVAAYNLPSLLPLSGQATEPLTLFLMKLSLSISTLWLVSFLTLVLVILAYREQSKQHTLELKKQREVFEAQASEESKRNNKSNRKLDYPNIGVI